MTENRNRYDVSVVAVFVLLYLILAAFSQRVLFLHEAVLLALTIWMIRMGWRLEYSPLTQWGIVYFAGVMLIIYATTIGTLISTSTFYLLAGLLILIVASLGPRLLEKVRPSS